LVGALGSLNLERRPRVLKPFTRLTNPFLRALSMTVFITAGQEARADLLTTTEIMIEHQATSALVLGSMFGPDPSSPLSFLSFVAPSGDSFSFATVAGTTYLGQDLALSGSGAVDSTGSYDVLTNIKLGLAELQIFGKEVRKENEDGTVEFTSDTDDTDKDGKKTGDSHSVLTITPDSSGRHTSKFVGYLTDKDGKKIPKSDLRGADRWNTKTKEWDILTSPDFPGEPGSPPVIASQGLSPEDGGPGTFTTTISAVPEPSALILAVTGAPLGLVYAWWRQRAPRGG
jgi:hypothetical protein